MFIVSLQSLTAALLHNRHARPSAWLCALSGKIRLQHVKIR